MKIMFGFKQLEPFKPAFVEILVQLVALKIISHYI